jgi:large subunit ribosomal protein L7Ae
MLYRFCIVTKLPTNNICQTAAVVAITEVRSEDKSELSKLVQAVKEGYMEKNEDAKRHWGGGIMGAKSNAKTAKKAKALESAIKI